jgi:hypothetical protein
MYPEYAYVIRLATDEDEQALRRLAGLDSQSPLSSPALIGEIDGIPAAAVSLTDGRVIADPFRSTAGLRQVLQTRVRAQRAYSRAPSLPERLHSALAPFRARTAST